MVNREDILFDVLKQASVRIHWAFLVSLIGCAIVAASVYSERHSYNSSLVKAAQIFILTSEENLLKLESENPGDIKIRKPNGEYVNVAPFVYWDANDIKTYSEFMARQKRAYNTLENIQLGSAQIPIVSQSIPLSEVDLFGGIILLVLSMWIYFSMSQILNIMENKATIDVLSDNLFYIKYIFVTIHFRLPLKGVLVVFLTIFMPTIVMCFSIYVWLGFWDIVHSVEYKEIIKEAYLMALGLRFVVAMLLLYFAVLILFAWIIISRKFNQYAG